MTGLDDFLERVVVLEKLTDKFIVFLVLAQEPFFMFIEIHGSIIFKTSKYILYPCSLPHLRYLCHEIQFKLQYFLNDSCKTITEPLTLSTASSQTYTFFSSNACKKKNKTGSSRRLIAKRPSKSKEFNQGPNISKERIAWRLDLCDFFLLVLIFCLIFELTSHPWLDTTT